MLPKGILIRTIPGASQAVPGPLLAETAANVSCDRRGNVHCVAFGAAWLRDAHDAEEPVRDRFADLGR